MKNNLPKIKITSFTLMIRTTSMFFLFFLLMGCYSGALLKDNAGLKELNRSGLLSVYVNRTLYDLNKPPADVGGLELIRNDILLANAGDGMDLIGDDNFKEAKQAWIEQVTKDLIEGLNQQAPFEVISGESANPTAYQKPIKDDEFTFDFDDDLNIKKDIYLKPSKLKLVTFQEIVKEVEGDAAFNVGNYLTLKNIGDFASSLKLDGLWVIEVDMGYKFYRDIDANRFTIRPSVSMKLMLIDKYGKIVFETADIEKGAGDRFETGIITVKYSESKDDFEFEKDSEVYNGFLEAVKKNIKYYSNLLNN